MPYEILLMWKKLLSDGGYIHITIPTIDYIFDDYRAFEPYHLSYFKSDTFINLCNKVGMKIIDKKIFNKDNGAGTSSMMFFLQKTNTI